MDEEEKPNFTGFSVSLGHAPTIWNMAVNSGATAGGGGHVFALSVVVEERGTRELCHFTKATYIIIFETKIAFGSSS